MTTEKDSGQELLNRIAAEVNKVVIGKEEAKQLLVVALLAQGKRILPLLDSEIEDNEGDPDLVEELKYLREELTGSS